MSTNKTEHYGLHSWAAGDDFLRSEINENFALLDEGGAVCGRYTGTGGSQEVALGFSPRGVLADAANGRRDQYVDAGGIALPGASGIAITVSGTGFTAQGSLNTSGQVFHYVAVR